MRATMITTWNHNDNDDSDDDNEQWRWRNRLLTSATTITKINDDYSDSRVGDDEKDNRELLETFLRRRGVEPPGGKMQLPLAGFYINQPTGELFLEHRRINASDRRTEASDKEKKRFSITIFLVVSKLWWFKWVITQAWGQDGWILAEFFFRIFLNLDEVEVHKNTKKERG